MHQNKIGLKKVNNNQKISVSSSDKVTIGDVSITNSYNDDAVNSNGSGRKENIPEDLQKAIDLVAKGDLEGALLLIKTSFFKDENTEAFKSTVLLLNNYSRFNHEYGLGIISKEEKDVSTNKIVKAVLDLIS